jgi:hypothetical protein
MAANSVGADQFGQASRVWLNSHSEYDNPHDRDALQSHLSAVLSQYPQIAIGPALDMALQRALNAGAQTNTQQPPARQRAYVDRSVSSQREYPAAPPACGKDETLSSAGDSCCTAGTLIDHADGSATYLSAKCRSL